MIPAIRLIYDVRQKLDRLNSARFKAIKIVEICAAANEAMYYLIKDRAAKFEQNSRYREELRPLEIKNALFEKVSEGDGQTTFKIPDDYYRKGRLVVEAAKSGCKNKDIPVIIIETDDLSLSLTDPNWKSSFEWEQCLGDEAADMFYLYNGVAFKCEKLKVDYLRKPKTFHAPSLVAEKKSYVDWNGEVQTKDVGWELDLIYKEGVNLTTLILSREIGDMNEFNLQANSIIQGNNIEKI